MCLTETSRKAKFCSDAHRESPRYLVSLISSIYHQPPFVTDYDDYDGDADLSFSIEFVEVLLYPLR